MKTLKFFLLSLLFLTGCATTQNYEKILASWVGQPLGHLIEVWGPPDEEFVHEGARYLTWVKGGTVSMPGTPPMYTTTVVGNTAYTQAIGGSPAYNVHLLCKTTFTVRENLVMSWRWEGNNCKATDPAQAR